MKPVIDLHETLARHHIATAKLHKAAAEDCTDANCKSYHVAMATLHSSQAADHIAALKEIDRGGDGDVATGSLDGPSKTLQFRPGAAEGSLMGKAVGFDDMLNRNSTVKVQGLVPRSGGPRLPGGEDPTAVIDGFRR